MYPTFRKIWLWKIIVSLYISHACVIKKKEIIWECCIYIQKTKMWFYQKKFSLNFDEINHIISNGKEYIDIKFDNQVINKKDCHN